MVMKFIVPLLFLLSDSLFSVVNPTFQTFLTENEGSSHIVEMNERLIIGLLEQNTLEGKDFLHLMTQIATLLEDHKIRALIKGKTLQQADKIFNLDKWNHLYVFFPFQEMVKTELGYTLTPKQGVFEVFLESDHTTSVNFTNITLQSHFGFKKYNRSTATFENAFGGSVSQFFVDFQLTSMVFYEPLKYALYFQGLDKPKRYDIHPLIKR